MYPVRHLFTFALALAVLPALAETVQLRRAGNATIITFEYITQDDVAIMVKRLDSDAVLNYKWEDLDLDWIKKNNPKVWAEREQMIAEAKAERKMTKKEAEADPFAQEVSANDMKSFLGILSISLQDGLKGVNLSLNRVEAVCAELQLEEAQFWVGYEDLKRASKIAGKNEPTAKAEPAAEELKEKAGKPLSAKAKAAAAKNKTRSPESQAAEAAARKDFEADARPFNTFGYLRMLAEGGSRAKPVWMMLRRAPADREAMKKIFDKYAQMAGELAEKPDAKASKAELVVVKKALENCSESIGKVSRENTAVEARLQTDCRTLLTLVLR
ncbi:MAG: hypothetical protein CK541_02145 [Opitutia bacterium]|nr:MAG: hypothetical protein CK541_02145 [Opitutae bacterium]